MKAYKFYIAAALMGAMTLTGCVGDLNVSPLDPTIKDASQTYTDAESYTKGLNKIYSVWALSGQDGAGTSDIVGLDPGNTALLRCWWTLQECTTDECKVAWADSWCNEINGLTWSTSKVESIEGVYQRLMYIVAVANDFLKNIDKAPEGVNIPQYKAEARFCRALAYYNLMDMFGIPPFITDQNYSSAPSQISRKDLFNWIEEELKEIHNQLPTARTTYGRADQGAVDALLARLYLNADIYTGTERYSDCIEACKSVIADGYSLASDYKSLFMANNGENKDAQKEIIFPVMFDGTKTQSYGMAALILGSRSSSDFADVPAGINGAWDGFRSTQNLTKLFDYKDNNAPTPATILDKRGIFNDHGGSTAQDITTTVTGTFKTEGWSVYKYTNMGSNDKAGSNPAFPDTDFPMFRLADIYLMYAEAVARGGQGGDLQTAVNYVNKLRERGYGDTKHDITADWLKADNFRNILNERARELYWEGTRRTDLIRFGLFTSASYLWPYKGGVITGVGVDQKFNVFPIPETDLSVNGNLKQNEGY